MTQWDKLLARIHRLSPDLRFAELAKILARYGYTASRPRSGSSHVTFRKASCYPITIPTHKPIKRHYVELVRTVVEKEGEDGQDPR